LGLFHKSIGNEEFYPAYVGYNLAGLLLVLLGADWINKRSGALLAMVVSAGVAAWEHGGRFIYGPPSRGSPF
jgi:hypothetical protein